MARPEFFKTLEKNQILSAVIEEILSSSEVICNFHGELVRISNKTTLDIKIGELVRLQVKTIEPLEFQVFDARSIKFERIA